LANGKTVTATNKAPKTAIMRYFVLCNPSTKNCPTISKPLSTKVPRNPENIPSTITLKNKIPRHGRRKSHNPRIPYRIRKKHTSPRLAGANPAIRPTPPPTEVSEINCEIAASTGKSKKRK
jgi:hypothetical protein